MLMYALGVAMYTSTPALAHTQDVPTLSKETTMTHLTGRPFRVNVPEEALVDLRLHAVIGGDGPPLLLIHG